MSNLLQTLAAVAQIISTIWLLFIGSTTIGKAIERKRKEREAKRKGTLIKTGTLTPRKTPVTTIVMMAMLAIVIVALIPVDINFFSSHQSIPTVALTPTATTTTSTPTQIASSPSPTGTTPTSSPQGTCSLVGNNNCIFSTELQLSCNQCYPLKFIITSIIFGYNGQTTDVKFNLKNDGDCTNFSIPDPHDYSITSIHDNQTTDNYPLEGSDIIPTLGKGQPFQGNVYFNHMYKSFPSGRYTLKLRVNFSNCTSAVSSQTNEYQGNFTANG